MSSGESKHAGSGGHGNGHAGKQALGHWLLLGAISLLPLFWFGAHFGHGVEAPLPTVLISGAAIFGSAFLLSWAADVAQLDIPRALALAVLALVAVLPEYAVDLYFAWRAGKDPTYTGYALANMTGANRLLVGVGWVLPLFCYALRYRQWKVALPREESVEVKYLALATAYAFVIWLKGHLAVYDTAVLFALYIAYARAAAKTKHAEPELEGPAETIAALGVSGRRLVTIGLFLFAGTTILTAAEPFAESLVSTGKQMGFDEFLLVQWVAPLASESPEFIVAMLFALRGSAVAAIGLMISSEVNQWTLLVGALPAAFSLSAGSLDPMPLEARQDVEVLLTAAQSLFALAIIADFSFSVVEGLLLFFLFVPQFYFAEPEQRLIQSYIYLALAVIWWALRWALARRGGQLRDVIT